MLILVIAALIVLYILFLPPDVRQELLDENSTRGGGSKDTAGANVILAEAPGRLDFLAKKEIEHTLPSVNLFTTEKSIILGSQRSLYVKNAWFDRQVSNITFSINDIENTDRVMLVFNVKQHEGRLRLALNGYEILNEGITTANIDPLTLPKRLLQEQNTIEVSVSGVGWKFWQTNEYTLESIQISADFTDVSTRQSTLVFQVTSTEKTNLDRVFVKFFPDCEIDEVGILDIILNNNKIFSSVPDCGIVRTLEVSPSNLLSNENTVIFRTERGSYLLDNIMVKSELKELTYPTYYFEINKTAYNDIVDNKLDAELQLDFVDDIQDKEAELVINTHMRGLDTKEESYSLNIDSIVKEGNNVIQIKPKNTLDVVNLKVVLERK